MKIFIDSVSPEEIRHAWNAGLADGVVFPEAAYARENPAGDSRAAIQAIVAEFKIPVCVEVGALDSDELYQLGRELAKLSDQIIVLLPLVDDAIAPMHRLSTEGIDVCATYVFNGAQAVLAAKAGASMVRVSLHDLDAQGQTSADAVTEIRSLLEISDCECDVMVASPVSTTQFTECVAAGAQIICVKPEVLRSLFLHPLTDRSLDRFLSSISRRGAPRD